MSATSAISPQKVRLRRSHSTAKVSDVGEAERREKAKQVDDPIHNNADSYFSTSSGFNNYRGLLNLMIILLALSNARLFLENIIKYGILINPFQWGHLFLQEPYSWPCLIIVSLSNVFILIAFFTECALSKKHISDRVGNIINVLNLTLLITFPAVVILVIHPNPIFSCPTLGIYTIVFLKLCSYACVNKWCRIQLRPGGVHQRRLHRSLSTSGTSGMPNGDVKSTRLQYPHNLTFSDLYYFMLAPTLCYELNFPRSSRIRKRFLMKRIIEMLFLSQLMAGLCQQWIVPTINNSLQPLTDMDVFKCAERLLKLAVPNHFIWLIFFYWFFHSCTNVIAELLRFGDRQFYGDWWNAETVAAFWKQWNIPVHRWAQRHLYKPLLRSGSNKMVASIAVFVVSAFFHEYLVSIPLRMFKTWAFMGMLGQVPLAMLTGKYCQGQFGNIAVWLSLILGQPIAILAYVHEYYIAHAVSN